MNKEKTCATCAWSRGDYGDLMCVNRGSDECGGWVCVDGYCECWEESE